VDHIHAQETIPRIGGRRTGANVSIAILKTWNKLLLLVFHHDPNNVTLMWFCVHFSVHNGTAAGKDGVRWMRPSTRWTVVEARGSLTVVLTGVEQIGSSDSERSSLFGQFIILFSRPGYSEYVWVVLPAKNITVKCGSNSWFYSLWSPHEII
jgi:hypothetical protein